MVPGYIGADGRTDGRTKMALLDLEASPQVKNRKEYQQKEYQQSELENKKEYQQKECQQREYQQSELENRKEYQQERIPTERVPTV